MVNKTQFYKTKVALAVVLSLGLTACGDDDTAASQPAEVKQVATGEISGVVLDTDGDPIVGATVTTGNAKATTDESGTYTFLGLPVANVAGADDDTSNNAFTIVIQAPEGYAKTATVNVMPSAQIDAENNDDVGVPLTTFIDGFRATAPNAVMPEMKSSVEGYVQNDITGEPIADAKIALDFTGVAVSTAAGTVNTPNGNASLSGETVSVRTDENGHFLFEGVSNDSIFDLSISGYSFVVPATTPATTPAAGQTQAGFAVTTAEQVENWVGTLTAVQNTSSDSKSPFIENIGSSIGAAGDAYNMLEPGFDGTTGIVFTMSEAVTQTIDATNVSVWSETLGAYKAVASVAQTATTLTVTLTDAIASGEEVQVLFQMNEIRDGAGNLFTVTEPTTDLGYTVANGTQTTYAQVRLQGHFVADTSAAITLAQVWSETTTDAYEDSDGDVIDGVNRLNNDADDSSARMSNRLDAEDNGAIDAAPAVNGTTATITIDQTAGIAYNLTMPAGAADNSVLDGTTGLVIDVNGDWTSLDNESLILTNVAVDDEISVTPLDDFGNPGTTQTITLTDNVPATTALQDSYGLAAISPLVFGGTIENVIDGGENAINGAEGTAGDPLIYVSPRLLAGSDASWKADILGGNRIFSGLGGLPTAATLGNDVVPKSIVPQGYTAEQFAAFAAAPIAATFGISFTEEVTVTGAPVWAGTSTLTGWASGTDAQSSNDTNTVLVNSNFVGLTVTTNDVLTLGNVDANNAAANAIDFTDTVADLATNNSGVDSKARVAFIDALPPFVTSAVFTVDALTVKFNESIAGDNWKNLVQTMILSDEATSSITLSDTGAGYAPADVTLSTDGMTVTFSNENLATGNFTALADIFSNGVINTALDTSEADDSYDFAENGIVRGHANLDFKDVADAQADGNTWGYYQDGTYGYAHRALTMDLTPVFLAASEIPEFDATLNLVSGVAGETAFTLTLTTGTGLAFDLDASFNQGFGALANVTNANVASGPLALTGAQVDNLLDGTGFVNIADSSGLIAQGGTAISFSVKYIDVLNGNEQILFNNNALIIPNEVKDTLGRTDPVQAIVVPF